MKQLTFDNLELVNPKFPIQVLTNDRSNQNQRDRVCSFHWHEQLELHYITEGELEITIGQKAHILQKGDFALIGENLPHYSFYTGRLQELILIFDLKNISADLADRNLRYHSVVRQDPVIRDFIEQLQGEYFRKAPGYYTACKGLLMQLMVHLSRNHIRADGESPEESEKRIRQMQRLSPVCSYIENHYADPLDAAVLAELLHVSESRFHHLFKENMGIAPGQYINKVRLHKALLLLRTGKYPLSEVAERCGFTDYNHFGRLFRKTFGCTPSQASSQEE